ncbi:MAG TPA: Txe/YoeB family addiction module toxin [Spirochaeta sp.]|nr:Txe/YoeB family addiction module toxin [Spirochaeta sp.]
MKIVFAEPAWEDYLYWQNQDRKILKRVNNLIKEISINPYEGAGKPEKLKHNYAGYFSRRITDEHRIVYRVDSDSLLMAQLRYHY